MLLEIERRKLALPSVLRRGCYRFDGQIARYCDGSVARNMISELTADCPRRDSASLMERCDVFFPGCAKLFYVRRWQG